MKVWVFNQFAGSPYNSSGAGERYHYVSKHLKRSHGVELTIFAASHNHLFLNQPKTTGPFTREVIDHVNYCWIRIPKYSPESAIGRFSSWFVFAFRLFFVRRYIGAYPEVIIVSSMSIFPIFAALYYRWRSTHVRKIILEIRDIWPLTLISLGKASRFNPLIVLLSLTEKFAYQYADSVISVLPYADRHIKTVVKREVEFHWIPNGIDVVEMGRTTDLAGQMPTLAAGKVIVTYSGAIGKANALDAFLDSFAYLKKPENFVYLIVGMGPELDRLKKKADACKSIIFHGKVMKDQVHGILLKSDILFVGWHDLDIYRFGVSANKYSDYMLARKPIVSSGNLAFDPVRAANCGQVVKAGDAKGIANAIEQIATMSEVERKSLGENGYSYLLRHNDMKVISEKFYDLLSS